MEKRRVQKLYQSLNFVYFIPKLEMVEPAELPKSSSAASVPQTSEANQRSLTTPYKPETESMFAVSVPLLVVVP